MSGGAGDHCPRQAEGPERVAERRVRGGRDRVQFHLVQAEYQTAQHGRGHGPSGDDGRLKRKKEKRTRRRSDPGEPERTRGRRGGGVRSFRVPRAHRVHLDLALGLEQQPADGHAHKIRPESRPRFVVDLVEQRQRVVDAVGKRDLAVINIVFANKYNIAYIRMYLCYNII